MHPGTTKCCWQPNLLKPGYSPRQIRNALALAHILNRTLIFPEMLCYCDRYW